MDQNTFINTYIDIIINALQDYIKANLQLQTQLKVNELVIAEKDKTIASLNQQIAENKIADDWKTKFEAAEANYSAALTKLSHMDALLKQVAEMKTMISARDTEISNLKRKKTSSVSKKVINTTDKKEEPILVPVVTQQKDNETLDDF